MENLINEIAFILKDYREEEGCLIDDARIKKWIEQFDQKDQLFLLSELKKILERRYFSRKTIYACLSQIIKTIASDFYHNNQKEMLANSVFLDLQGEWKSQSILLRMVSDILQDEYKIKINDCGAKSQTNYIYLDDLLCTGNTLFQNFSEWLNRMNGVKRNIDLLRSGTIRIISAFIFTHKEHYNKTFKRLKFAFNYDFISKARLYGFVNIDNTLTPSSKIDFIKPLYNASDQQILDYEHMIEAQVDEYCSNKKFTPPSPSFYRPPTFPTKEVLFSNQENRSRFENIILKKGIEILRNASVQKQNVRALGYDLPSHKNFGFGTLAFTYRNVPNNTPIVFWYSGGGFMPLFVKNPTSQEKIKEETLQNLMEYLNVK